MAGPSSYKGQNKVGDNFKIGAQQDNVLVSSMWVEGPKTGFIPFWISKVAKIHFREVGDICIM